MRFNAPQKACVDQDVAGFVVDMHLVVNGKGRSQWRGHGAQGCQRNLAGLHKRSKLVFMVCHTWTVAGETLAVDVLQLKKHVVIVVVERQGQGLSLTWFVVVSFGSRSHDMRFLTCGFFESNRFDTIFESIRNEIRYKIRRFDTRFDTNRFEIRYESMRIDTNRFDEESRQES